jgi:DNA-binding MarR family transcriptional regulator
MYTHVNDQADTMKTNPDITKSAQRHANERDDELDVEACREVLGTCGSFNLRRASRVVTQLYDDILQPTGLRSTQIAVLVALAAEPELSLARLARELVLSPSTLSRTVRPLERDGLLKAYSAGQRGKSLRLTKRGEKRLRAAVPYWQKAQEKFTELVGVAVWEELSEQLGKIVAAMRS